MTNAKQQAAHDLRRLSVQLKGILALSDDLERIGSLEQAAAEAENRARIARAEEDDVKARVDRVRQEAAAIEAGAEELRSAVKQEAAALVDAAKGEAKAIVQKARQDAEKTTKDAEERLKAIQQEIARQQRALEVCREGIKDAEAERGRILSEINDLKRRIG